VAEKRGVTTGQPTTTWAVRKTPPFGIVDENTEHLSVCFGSSAKASDFIVDRLESWWWQLASGERDDVSLLQIKLENSQERHGRRTQFLDRLVAFVDLIANPI
jgi:hypothetical protein